MSLIKKFQLIARIQYIKITNWEFWPFNIVYIPIFVYWLYLSIKCRSFFFFSTSNPSIKNAGFLMESKYDIYETMPEYLYPKTIFITPGKDIKLITLQLEAKGIQLPFIVKPDTGMRGLKVKLLNTFEDLYSYHSSATFSYLIQEYIAYENEVGIFYTRYPEEKSGVITGIVGKEFLTIIGDGISTIETLVKKNDRHLLQLNKLRAIYGNNLKNILALNEKYTLVPYGNHSRGSKFIDLSNLIDEQLTSTINLICQSIPDFYYGRLDIKFKNWEDLKNGENFSIIEVNGAGSEPTHIYDPTHSIFYAWKEIKLHCKILYEISLANKKLRGLEFMTTKEGMKMLRENKKQVASLT
jgi:hypothetical protein